MSFKVSSFSFSQKIYNTISGKSVNKKEKSATDSVKSSSEESVSSLGSLSLSQAGAFLKQQLFPEFNNSEKKKQTQPKDEFLKAVRTFVREENDTINRILDKNKTGISVKNSGAIKKMLKTLSAELIKENDQDIKAINNSLEILATNLEKTTFSTLGTLAPGVRNLVNKFLELNADQQ